MHIEELYEKFCRDFRKSVNLTRLSSTTEWTKEILKYFSCLGENEKEQYKIYANPKDIEKVERSYLVDLCWSKEGKEGHDYKDYKGLEFILESEWSTEEDEIMWDFCKLIDIKANLKVMVICIEERRINGIVEEMAATIKKGDLKLKEEIYLVIIFVPLPSVYNPERYIIKGCRIDSNGINQSLQPTDFNLTN